MIKRFLGSALVAALVVGGLSAAPVLAQRPVMTAPTDPARGDALNNPEFKGPEVLKFIGLKKGWKVADIFPGRFTTAFAGAVGKKGRVYAVMPTEIIKIHPEITAQTAEKKTKPEYANVEFSTPAINDMVLPGKLDAVFIRQNYHDLHVKFMGPADVAAFNGKVFAALKPGGIYVVLDHVALAGSGVAATERLHRIDPAMVKAEVLAAGFVLDGESGVLANADDPHTKLVLDPAILGKTDQFLLKFKKPKK
ncbi:class I SAM-dependent methyltransferase [soil metagenome]